MGLHRNGDKQLTGLSASVAVYRNAEIHHFFLPRNG